MASVPRPRTLVTDPPCHSSTPPGPEVTKGRRAVRCAGGPIFRCHPSAASVTMVMAGLGGADRTTRSSQFAVMPSVTGPDLLQVPATWTPVTRLD